MVGTARVAVIPQALVAQVPTKSLIKATTPRITGTDTPIQGKAPIQVNTRKTIMGRGTGATLRKITRNLYLLSISVISNSFEFLI